MKVFFTCSFSGKAKYQLSYDKIIAAIKKHDVELITTEGNSYLTLLEEKREKRGIAKEDVEGRKFNSKPVNYLHYESVKRSIFEADVVIIDNSNESFRLGHEASIALEHNKPVLVLSQHRNMADFINHKNFYGALYNQYNIEFEIDKFLKEAARKIYSKRFNMFISEEQYEFLDQKSKREGLNMSEYLRKLIEDDRA